MAESPTNITFINPDETIAPAILAGLVGRNVSQIYQWAQNGRLPDIKNGTFSYRQCLDHLVTSLVRMEEAKALKDKARFDGEGLHPLVEEKLKQNIKTERAREADLWQKIAIKRNEFVSFDKKLDLVEGFILSIRDTLLSIANNNPALQGQIDAAMEELYQAGKVLVEEADIDANEFIDTMLAKEVELTDD